MPDGESYVVSFVFNCGAPDALCSSGGAYRVEQINGTWEATDLVSSWVS